MIEIAKVLKAQGVHGEVKTQLFSDNYDEFAARGFAHVKSDGGFKRVDYDAVRIDPPYVYLKIDGIETRNDAEKLNGVFLFADRKDFPEPDEGEYYIVDLIGLSVFDENGSMLGILKEIFQHGAADVYSVKGAKSFMFPALKKVIRDIDIKGGIMLVDSKALSEVAVYEDL